MQGSGGVEERVNLEIEIGLTLGIEVRRGPEHFMSECQKKERDQTKQREHLIQMQQIADLAEKLL